MMKMIFAAVALVSVAACDDGGVIDQTIQQGVRQSAVESCAAWVPQSEIAMAAGIDGQQLCACAVDEVLEGKTVSELPELRPDSAELRAAVAQCIGNIQPSAPEPETS